MGRTEIRALMALRARDLSDKELERMFVAHAQRASYPDASMYEVIAHKVLLDEVFRRTGVATCLQCGQSGPVVHGTNYCTDCLPHVQRLGLGQVEGS
jgi:hypothetical protein